MTTRRDVIEISSQCTLCNWHLPDDDEICVAVMGSEAPDADSVFVVVLCDHCRVTHRIVTEVGQA